MPLLVIVRLSEVLGSSLTLTGGGCRRLYSTVVVMNTWKHTDEHSSPYQCLTLVRTAKSRDTYLALGAFVLLHGLNLHTERVECARRRLQNIERQTPVR
jgi:hypothetical protein